LRKKVALVAQAGFAPDALEKIDDVLHPHDPAKEC
jgi:hypothetical protein